MKLTLLNSVTIYIRDSKSKYTLNDIILEYENVFWDINKTVNVLEGEYILITLKLKVIPKLIKLYLLGKKDYKVIETSFNKLY